MFRMLVFLSLLPILAVNSQAGVDYYSGVVDVTFDGAAPDSWAPIITTDTGGSAIKLQSAYSSGLLTWSDISGANYTFQTTDSDANAANAKLQTITDSTFSATDSRLESVSNQTLGLTGFSSQAVGYLSGNANNYFGWRIIDNSSLNTIYVGWANIKYDPTTSTSSASDEFIIVDWAYNRNASTITVGDRTENSSSPTVPEPAGFAVLSAAALGILLKRRR